MARHGRRARARRRRRARGRASRALRALASSALALPGVAGHAAAEGSEGWVGAYSYSLYAEDDIDPSLVTPGSATERYTIQSHQLQFEGPVFPRFDMGVDLVYETMSGATPWYVIPDTDGEPIQVMTGATIEEQRTDAQVRSTYHLDSGSGTLAAGVSVENDYLAINGSLTGERYFNEKNTTLTSGGGFSIDRITPTDADLDPLRVSEAHKQSYSLFAGVSQVLGRGSVVQSSLSYQYSHGFLSDPYKRVLVEGAPIADSRPGTRHQLAWLTRFRQHLDGVNASFHADYRFAFDDWAITSHTVELAWYQGLFWQLRLVPALRYYSQSQADFYAPWFETAPGSGHASSDYRLSPYGALSWRIAAEKDFAIGSSRWRLHAGWERYLSDADFALGRVAVANPGLVSFNLFTVGLSARF